jgi:hypothetical protein
MSVDRSRERGRYQLHWGSGLNLGFHVNSPPSLWMSHILASNIGGLSGASARTGRPFIWKEYAMCRAAVHRDLLQHYAMHGNATAAFIEPELVLRRSIPRLRTLL